ncbi:hypothetical protein Nepgr_017925 [Nepenthes gracilis]|uniref:Uncharacterized protein n=1 Tax=Nepenthes gracilis TaxID=150966 RepID=A0AAD3SSH6_NEPGR|nr:hypothetical protein Nepgr_017925 [Nepenthes gracilis]
MGFPPSPYGMDSSAGNLGMCRTSFGRILGRRGEGFVLYRLNCILFQVDRRPLGMPSHLDLPRGLALLFGRNYAPRSGRAPSTELRWAPLLEQMSIRELWAPVVKGLVLSFG